MQTRTGISLITLFAMTMLAAVPAQSVTLPEKRLAFDAGMVYGATMVSSGYPNGSMTFNANGSLSCSNYPAVVQCKSWQITPDGKLLREFTDSHTGTSVEVQAYWKLLGKSGRTLQVSQTSNNSQGATVLTVTVK